MVVIIILQFLVYFACENDNVYSIFQQVITNDAADTSVITTTGGFV